MSNRFFCNSDACIQRGKGPFILEVPQEAVMDGNNMATIFCPQCGKEMKPLPTDADSAEANRFYCYNESCGDSEKGVFYIDLPGEAVMDTDNLATIFCPKCGKEMKP